MTSQSQTQVGVQQWSIDLSHSEISFSVRHLMISTVRGNFTRFTGTATFDPQEIENGSISVEIDAASVDTRDEQRDGHLRSADFLDAENYPTLSFASRSVERLGNGEYSIAGDLTIRGVTRPLTLKAEFTEVIPDPFGGTRIGVSAATEIDRTEFGLSWNQLLETGGIAVGEHIKIEIAAQLVMS